MIRYLLSLALFFCAPVAFAQSLRALDEIQDRARDLKDFLANNELRAEYLKAAQAYAGSEDAFPEASYNAILKQMAVLIEADPVFAQRAWSKTDLGPTFSVQVDRASYFEFEQEKWLAFLDEVKAKLREKARPWEDWWNGENKVEFAQALNLTDDEIRDRITRAGPGKEKAEKIALEHTDLIAALLLYQLEDAGNSADLESPHWETVVGVLRKLASKKNLLWPAPLGEKQKIASYWKTVVPEFMNAEDTAERFGIMHTGDPGERTITFRAVRPFHALFRGLLVKECIAGDCASLERLSARRFAIPLLKDIWIQFVEEAGHASGHIQGVFMHDRNGRSVMDVDLMAGKLREQVPLKLSQEAVKKATIFELWLRQMQNHLPAATLGVAMGAGKGANNEKVQEFVQARKTYLLGEILGPAERFMPTDTDAAYRLSLLGWRMEEEHSYDNCLAFDGCNGKAGQLILLNPDLIEGEDLTPARLLALWKRGNVSRLEILKYGSHGLQVQLANLEPESFVQVMAENGVLVPDAEAYVQYLSNSVEIDPWVIRRLRLTNLPFIRKGLGALAKTPLRDLPDDFATGPELQFKIFNEAEPGERSFLMRRYFNRPAIAAKFYHFQDALELIKALKSGLSPAAFEQIAEAISLPLAKAKFSVSKINKIRLLFSNVPSIISILKASANNYPSAADLISLVTPLVEKPSIEYKSELHLLMVSLTQRFMSFHPTAAEVHQWIAYGPTIGNRIQLRTLILERPLTSEQGLAVLTAERGGLSEEYQNAIKKFFRENWRQALRETQTYEDAVKAIKTCFYISDCIEMRAWALRFVHTPDRFFALYQPLHTNPNEQYLRALEEERLNQIDFLLSLKPSVIVVRWFRRTVTDAAARAKLDGYLRLSWFKRPLRTLSETVLIGPSTIGECDRMLSEK